MLQNSIDAPKRLLRVRRYDKQVDLFCANIVPIQFGGVAKNTLQFALNFRDDRFVFQRLAPKLNYELIIHFGLEA